jgi:hypothetical protein
MARARTILGNLNFYHPPDDSGILENFGSLQEVWEIPEFSDVPEIVDYVTIFVEQNSCFPIQDLIICIGKIWEVFKKN